MGRTDTDWARTSDSGANPVLCREVFFTLLNLRSVDPFISNEFLPLFMDATLSEGYPQIFSGVVVFTGCPPSWPAEVVQENKLSISFIGTFSI